MVRKGKKEITWKKNSYQDSRHIKKKKKKLHHSSTWPKVFTWQCPVSVQIARMLIAVLFSSPRQLQGGRLNGIGLPFRHWSRKGRQLRHQGLFGRRGKLRRALQGCYGGNLHFSWLRSYSVILHRCLLSFDQFKSVFAN